MKRLAMTAVLLAAASARALGEPAFPTASSLVSQDPLTRQILFKVLHGNGVETMVRIASGQAIKLKPVDLGIQPAHELKDAPNSGQAGDAARGLKPVPGLVAAAGNLVPDEKTDIVRKPAKQLKTLNQQGAKQSWGEAAKAGS